MTSMLDDDALIGAVRTAVGLRADVSTSALDPRTLWSQGTAARRRARRTTVLTAGVALAAVVTGLAVALVGPGDKHAAPTGPRPTPSPQTPLPAAQNLLELFTSAIADAIGPYDLPPLHVTAAPAYPAEPAAYAVPSVYAAAQKPTPPGTPITDQYGPNDPAFWSLQIVQNAGLHTPEDDIALLAESGVRGPHLTSGSWPDGTRYVATPTGRAVVAVRPDGIELSAQILGFFQSYGQPDHAADPTHGNGLAIVQAIESAVPQQPRRPVPPPFPMAKEVPSSVRDLAKAAAHTPDVLAGKAVLYVRTRHVGRGLRLSQAIEQWIPRDGGMQLHFNGHGGYHSGQPLAKGGALQPPPEWSIGGHRFDWAQVRQLPYGSDDLAKQLFPDWVDYRDAYSPGLRFADLQNVLILSPLRPQQQVAIAELLARYSGATVHVHVPNALGIDAVSIAVNNQRLVFSSSSGAFFERDVLNADGSVAGGTVYTVAGVDALRDRPAIGAKTLP